MISKLSDEAALNLLMTSEFDENLSPKEYKEMLIRYRYFYRLLHGRLERSVGDSDFELERLKERLESQQRYITELQTECARKDDEIGSLRARKLTLKERFLGKIINKDEDK